MSSLTKEEAVEELEALARALWDDTVFSPESGTMDWKETATAIIDRIQPNKELIEAEKRGAIKALKDVLLNLEAEVQTEQIINCQAEISHVLSLLKGEED